MHPLEDCDRCCHPVPVGGCPVGMARGASRRAMYSHRTAFWAVVSRRFDEADEMRHCPPADVIWGAECYEDEDC